jgi:hypothetical protein
MAVAGSFTVAAAGRNTRHTGEHTTNNCDTKEDNKLKFGHQSLVLGTKTIKNCWNVNLER